MPSNSLPTPVRRSSRCVFLMSALLANCAVAADDNQFATKSDPLGIRQVSALLEQGRQLFADELDPAEFSVKKKDEKAGSAKPDRLRRVLQDSWARFAAESYPFAVVNDADRQMITVPGGCPEFSQWQLLAAWAQQSRVIYNTVIVITKDNIWDRSTGTSADQRNSTAAQTSRHGNPEMTSLRWLWLKIALQRGDVQLTCYTDNQASNADGYPPVDIETATAPASTTVQPGKQMCLDFSTTSNASIGVKIANAGAPRPVALSTLQNTVDASGRRAQVGRQFAVHRLHMNETKEDGGYLALLQPWNIQRPPSLSSDTLADYQLTHSLIAAGQNQRAATRLEAALPNASGITWQAQSVAPTTERSTFSDAMVYWSFEQAIASLQELPGSFATLEDSWKSAITTVIGDTLIYWLKLNYNNSNALNETPAQACQDDPKILCPSYAAWQLAAAWVEAYVGELTKADGTPPPTFRTVYTSEAAENIWKGGNSLPMIPTPKNQANQISPESLRRKLWNYARQVADIDVMRVTCGCRPQLVLTDPGSMTDSAPQAANNKKKKNERGPTPLKVAETQPYLRVTLHKPDKPRAVVLDENSVIQLRLLTQTTKWQLRPWEMTQRPTWASGP